MTFDGFESKFKFNDKLKRTAVNDPDHVGMFFSPEGEHVALIHEALNTWLRANGLPLVPDSEVNARKFGQKTHDAVLLYKRTKDIRNYKNEIDPIVGKKTVVALDKELPPADFNPPGPAPVPEREPLVVPFEEVQPLLIAQEKDDRNKDDLDHAPRDPVLPPGAAGTLAKARVMKARTEATIVLHAAMAMELTSAGSAGIIMARTFNNNNVPRGVITFPVDHVVPQLIKDSPEFADAKKNFVAEMKRVLDGGVANTNTLDYRFLSFQRFRRLSAPMVSFGLRTSTRLKFCVGSTQGVDVFLEDFAADSAARKWTATLLFAYFDHFGANDSDLLVDTHLHGSDGQVALWVLAHDRRPGHFPFVSKMLLREVVSESY